MYNVNKESLKKLSVVGCNEDGQMNDSFECFLNPILDLLSLYKDKNIYNKFGIKHIIEDINTDGVNVRVVYSKDYNDDLTSDIRDLAIEIDADGIIIGSKGRTATAALFLGSFAEKLINNTTNFSLMVVRKKKEYDSILDRLKKNLVRKWSPSMAELVRV